MKKRVYLAGLAMWCALSTPLLAGESDSMKYIYKLSQEGFYDQSSYQITQFLQQYPNSKYYTTLQSLKGYNFFMNKEYDAAKIVYLSLVNSSVSDDAKYYLEQICLIQGDVPTAKQYLDSISSTSSMKSYGNFALANHYYETANYLLAVDLYQTLITTPSSLQSVAQLKLALSYYGVQNYSASIAMFKTFLSQNNLDASQQGMANFYLGLDYEAMSMPNLALLAYQQVIALKTGDYYTQALYNSAVIALSQKNVDQFLSYTSALKQAGEMAQANALEGEYYYQQGNYQQAIISFQSSLAEQSDETVQYNLVVAQATLQQYQAVLNSLAGLESGKYSSAYHYYYVWAHYNLGDYGVVYAYSQDPTHLVVESNLNQSFLEMIASSDSLTGHEAESISNYQTLLTLVKKPEYYYNLLVLAKKTSNLSLAESTWKAYLQTADTTYLEKNSALMSDIYIANGKKDIAKKIYLNYLSTHSNSQFTSNLAGIYLEEKSYKKVLEVTQSSMDNGDVAYLRAIAYSKLGDIANAISNFRIAANKSSDPKAVKDSYWNLIQLENETEDYTSANQDIQYYLKNYKDYTITLTKNLGVNYFKLGDYDQAISVFKLVATMKGEASYGLFMQGQSFYSANDFSNALAVFQQLVTQYPTSKQASEGLYWIFLIQNQQGNIAQEVSSFNQLLQQYPNSTYVVQGIRLITTLPSNEQGALAPGIEKGYTVIKSNATKQIIIEWLADFYQSIQNYSKAQQFVSLLPNSPAQQLRLGILYYLSENYTAAIECFKPLVNNDTYRVKANYYLGNSYFAVKNYSGASLSFEQISGSDITSGSSLDMESSRLKEAMSEENSGQIVNAIKTLNGFVQSYPKSTLLDVAYFKLGQDYSQLQQYPQAIKAYQTLVNNYPDSTYNFDGLKGLIAAQIENKSFTQAQASIAQLKKINSTLAAQFQQVLTQRMNSSKTAVSGSVRVKN